MTASTPDRPKPLSVGVIVGGFTTESIRDQFDSDLNMNIEFQIPGHLITPDFEGIRAGTFRKADRLLKIQVALPVDLPDDPYSYGVQAMKEAVDVAEACSVRRRVELIRPLTAAVAARATGNQPPAEFLRL